ncbi:MAG TPA: hypothetical protein VNE82_21630 [Candidatus Binataceae bacterium]|nr:hypothetical protein [Candidatus Binataceae bacterium]
MSVTQLTRFKGGKPEEMIKAAKQAKAHWEKQGAEYVGFSRIHTGSWTGQWLYLVRFPNWTAMGKAQDAISQDADFQKLLAHVLTMAEIVGRTTTIGVDL